MSGEVEGVCELHSTTEEGLQAGCPQCVLAQRTAAAGHHKEGALGCDCRGCRLRVLFKTCAAQYEVAREHGGDEARGGGDLPIDWFLRWGRWLLDLASGILPDTMDDDDLDGFLADPYKGFCTGCGKASPGPGFGQSHPVCAEQMAAARTVVGTVTMMKPEDMPDLAQYLPAGADPSVWDLEGCGPVGEIPEGLVTATEQKAWLLEMIDCTVCSKPHIRATGAQAAEVTVEEPAHGGQAPT